MFRRSRFSVRPNVGGPGRTAAAPQESAAVSQEATQSSKEINDNVSVSVVTDSKSADTPGAAATTSGDGNETSGEGSSSSAGVQRRKRFSVKPRVAPGRPSTLPRVLKSPAKVVSESPAKVAELEPITSNEVTTPAALRGLRSPSPPKPSANRELPHIHSTSVSSDGSADPRKETHPLPEGGRKPEKTPDSLIKVSPRPVDKVSMPDKESAELSEKAKTLLLSKGRSSVPRSSLSRLLNDPSDIQRLEKAQKLRDLLKQEMRKEKAIRKSKKHIKQFSVDPTKMTMRDLIRYLPLSNPMSSSLEDSTQEKETGILNGPRLEVPPERGPQKPEPEVIPKMGNQMEEEEEGGEETEQEAGQEEEEDEALMVPQVKVAEDGTLILDEESLTVEVQRAKGSNPEEDRDPIFERGSTTMYSSFRAPTYCKPWSSEETDMFFLAISMVGTDFSMICQLFPNRTRSEIRNKFKKEERQNSWRVDKAFEERRKLDIEYFSKLLQKILEFQESRKNLKSLVEKNAPKKHQRKSKGKKAASKISSSEEEEDEDVLLSSEAEDGEKENEELCEEAGTLVCKAKRKRKLRSEEDPSAAKLTKRKSKTGAKSSKEDVACIPKDTEAALPEDQPNSEVCDSAEMEKTSKGPAIRPAKLSRVPEDRDGASAKQNNTSKKKANEETSSSRIASNNDVDSSGDEDYPIKPAKPTRYGRVPKPTALLNYPAKEDSPSTQPQLQPKSAPKRGRTAEAPSATKKPKPGMLRASPSEASKEEDANMEEQGSSNGGAREESSAPVPASLCSPHAAIPQEEEEDIVEELDIFADMSVLDMSQDALCLNSSCERAQIETGSREPCVHQLDLLVDVIDFLSSEHTEGRLMSEVQSYNEAAQTLLTISNVSLLSQSDTTQDQNTGIPLDVGNETCRRLEEEIVAEFIEENSSRPVLYVSLDQKAADTFDTTPVESTHTESSPEIGEGTGQEQGPVSGPDSTLPSQSSPQTRKAYSSKVKPKPNLARASRAAHSKPQPETSPPGSTVESQSAAPDLSKEPTPNIAEHSGSSKKQTCDLEQATMEAKCTDAETSENAPNNEPAFREPLTQESGGDHEVHECQNSSTPQSSQPIRMKPKPNIPQISKYQTTKETSLSSNLQSTHKTTSEVDPQPTCTLDTDKTSPSAGSASAGTPPMNVISTLVSREELTASDVKKTSTGLADQVSSEPNPTDADKIECGPKNQTLTESLAKQSNTSLVQEGGDHNFIPKAEVQQCQNSSRLPSSQPTRIRFQRVKQKPNLPRLSKSVQSKPERLESTCTTTSEVEPQPICTFFSDITSPGVDSALAGTPPMKVSSTRVSTEELPVSDVRKTSTGLADQVSSEPNPTDADKIECGPNNQTLTESLAQQSNKSLVQEGGDHVVIPEVHECQNSSRLPSSQPTRRTRFQEVKPKPDLSQILKSAQSKPQTTKETLLSANLESSSKTTSEVEPLPTCSSSTEKTSQRSSSVTPSMGFSTSVVRTEETCSQLKEAAADKLADQVDSGKENEGMKKATTFGAAAETQSFNAERTQTSANNVVPSAFRPECHAKQAAALQGSKLMEESSNSALKPESSDRPSIEAQSPTCPSVTSPLEPTEHPSSSGDNNKEVVSEASKETTQRRRRLPKVKPNLRSPARAIRCVSQSKDGGESSKQISHITSQYQLVGENSDLQSGNDEGVAMESKNKSTEVTTAGKETEVYTAPCQDKTEGGTSLKSDGQIFPALPSNILPLGQNTVKILSWMTTDTHPLKCADDPPLPKTSTTTTSVKPSLGKSSPQPQQVADSDPVSTAAAQDHVPDPAVPAEGAIEDESTLSTAQNQTFASLSIFPETLSVPSDPDEPFFILSLTEIPVVSAGEVLDATPQPPTLIPEAHWSVQQSLAVGNVVAGQDASTPDVLISNDEMRTTMSASMEDDVVPPEDQQACTLAAPWRAASSPKRKPKGFLSFLSGTSSATESNESTRVKAASRRPTVKALLRKRPTRHKNPSTTTQAPVDTTLPEPEALADTLRPEPEAPVATTLAEPEAPVGATLAESEAPVDTMLAEPEVPVDTTLAEPEAGPCAAEVFGCEHHSSTAVQEEPTNVSQYFLSDIFTEVQDT
ncbi:transcription factor TFIIIB component B'' homolog isoform X3 [Dunckerocampus dactyliophorus]|uniref:transcription factor TFIIIB component B'' homolog isoform X3 n=1 Tax=Dunckerocampus dactyliophorus TaxID=161453 RepID=UPI0024059B8C|nr:transcription factor TFIIIB component B'' homolog isoform X3 [Dunckerocampus dactyliophorus]